MLRWIGRIFSFLVLLVLVAVGLVAFMPADRVARLAAEQIRVATGREVSVSGEVSVTFWPVLGAEVGRLEIGNADWSVDGPMLLAHDAAIGIDAAALLRGEIRITHVQAVSPTIRLESRKDGRVNWQFTEATAPDAEATAPSRSLSIERVRISDATLIHAAEGAPPLRLGGLDLSIDWPERAGPAEIEAVFRPAEVPVTLSARVENFGQFLAGEMRAVELAMDAPHGHVRLGGQAAVDGMAHGAFTLETGDTSAFLKSLGLPGADLPEGLGRSLSLSSGLDLTPGGVLTLRELIADLGAGNRLRGSARIELGDVPRVTAELTAGALDLSALADPDDGSASPETEGWSTTPIDASGLAAFDGEIALVAESIDLGALHLGPSRVVLRNDRARMVLDLQDVSVYDGRVTGELVMNNRDGLSVGGRLRGAGLEMQGLLRDAARITRLAGEANAELEFLGAGQSVHAIMHSLRGTGSVTVGRGTITGIDLDRLMRSGDAGQGTTVFDSLSASFTIDGGTLVNDDLLMLLPDIEARGAGRVGLGARDIDYLFTPKALRVNEGRGLAIPVRIRGPWSAPRVEPDLEAAVDLNLAEERRKAEREIREKVETRVLRELGVTPEEGQSVEDAIEKKIEREIGKGLRQLFD